MPRRSSKRIPIHLPIPPNASIPAAHPPQQAANPQHECFSSIILNSESILNRQCGATPTRSEDPEATILPGRPVTADLKPRQGTPKGPIRRPHATPVEKSAEKFGKSPEGSSLNDSLDSQSVQQEEQSEIAKKLGESPESDSMSNSGNQHELHLRNLSPRTEKISSRNPKEPVRDLYRPSRDLMRSSKTEQQVKTQVHHPRLSITEVTEQRIIGSLPSLEPASPFIRRQPQEEPIRVPRRSLNKALKRDRRFQKFETNLRTWKLPARIFHQTTPPHKQYPSPGIAAAVQRRKAGRNETRRRAGYSGTTQVVHHQCSNKSRARKTYELKLNL
ncbi:uncharacterized protein EAF02_003745 [Botrytis sinoallii]|uniref:uncharacterized protein n=1 Tax=Botrytis sinoallii TaxID=1463999 RepID=UPI0019011C6F|nr:uncharacterized protein EAF02_003745 [Botrytis sinoallii]KAF7887098.1 hypothetical protein EAF02_003745 [Botrytis sinoallii]